MSRGAALAALALLPAAAAQAPEVAAGLRAGRLEVLVLDGRGEPVAGARVRVRQLRHDFLFGANLFTLAPTGDEPRDRRYREEFAGLFDAATLPFYWARYEPSPGRTDEARLRELALWCRERGIRTKGHPLLWNHPAGVPAWLPAEPGAGLVEARVAACVAAFGGLVDAWDVVNEPADPGRFPDNPLTRMIEALGKERWLRGAFAAARRAGPGAFLLVNDYDTGRDYLEALALLGAGEGRFPADAIGLQSHMHGGLWAPARTAAVLERFGAAARRYGVPLHFTEVTIPSAGADEPAGSWDEAWRGGPSTPAGERRQAEAVPAFYRALFACPWVAAITWWDLSDHGAWRLAPAGLLRADMSRKPAAEALRRLLREEWWTDLEARTGEAGLVSVRALFGAYRVEVAAPGGREASLRVDFPRPWPPARARDAVHRVKVGVGAV